MCFHELLGLHLFPKKTDRTKQHLLFWASAILILRLHTQPCYSAIVKWRILKKLFKGFIKSFFGGWEVNSLSVRKEDEVFVADLKEGW